MENVALLHCLESISSHWSKCVCLCGGCPVIYKNQTRFLIEAGHYLKKKTKWVSCYGYVFFSTLHYILIILPLPGACSPSFSNFLLPALSWTGIGPLAAPRVTNISALCGGGMTGGVGCIMVGVGGAHVTRSPQSICLNHDSHFWRHTQTRTLLLYLCVPELRISSMRWSPCNPWTWTQLWPGWQALHIIYVTWTEKGSKWFYGVFFAQVTLILRLTLAVAN